jgi:hypothetical protein
MKCLNCDREVRSQYCDCPRGPYTNDVTRVMREAGMTNHTPGPWRYKPHSVDSNYMLIFCSADPSEGDNLRGYCGEANARLIAAAPDLLEALQSMCEYTAELNPSQGFDGHDADAVNKARAAIAKATGAWA